MQDLNDPRKRQEAEAMGRLIFNKYYSNQEKDPSGVEVPSVNKAGISYGIPQGLTPEQRDNFQAYIKKIQMENQDTPSQKIDSLIYGR